MDALAPDSRTDRQLAGARRLLAHLGEILQADLAVRLWNGERVPLGAAAAEAPVIAIRTPRAIARLVRRPVLTTLIELLAAGDIDFENATLLDIAAKRGTMRTKGLLRRIDKKLAFQALWPFLFGRASDMRDHTFGGAIAERESAGRDNKALIQFHYDLSND